MGRVLMLTIIRSWKEGQQTPRPALGCLLLDELRRGVAGNGLLGGLLLLLGGLGLVGRGLQEFLE